MLTTDSIDLNNVSYDDVLQLYKGWKKTEGELRDKKQELTHVQSRVKSLQDSHNKFRGQIQALESVKELTITLQSQISVLQSENRTLLAENQELTDLNAQAEELLRDRVEREAKQTKLLKEMQDELTMVKEKYANLEFHQREMDALAKDEQLARLTAETKLKAANETISSLKDENITIRSQFETKSIQLSQCGDELAHASEQLGILSKEISNIRFTNDKLASTEAEVGVLRGDLARLVHLLEYYPALKGFLKRWRESEGMSFVGIGSVMNDVINQSSNKSLNYSHDISASMTTTKRSDLDMDDEYDEDDYHSSQNIINTWSRGDLSLSEFEHIKRVHGGDPFPMSTTMEEEELYWVPRRAATIGMEFLSSNLPHAPPSVIMEFLRKMNKVWARREQRKVKRLKEIYETQIKDLKRQVANAKPYRGVMQEKQIRRLQSQLKDDRKKQLTGRAVSAEDRFEEFVEDDFVEEEDIDSLPPHHRRPCMIQSSTSAPQSSGSARVRLEKASTKKLLEASLISLETLGRQVVKTTGGHEDGSGLAPSTFPSESYLRGALWLGKNISIVLEELSDSLDELRTKHLSQVAAASHDNDPHRSSHRLTLLAASSINEVLSLAHQSRSRAREILQGTSSIVAGEAERFQELLTTLPIESVLTSPARRGSPRRGSSPSRGSTSFSVAFSRR